MNSVEVVIQEADFDVSELQRQLAGDAGDAGAIASFTGLVRRGNTSAAITSMHLEHYPGMTQSSIQTIVEEARGRWDILDVRVVHRVGELQSGAQIVFVGVSARHRSEAFLACEFIMDYLKTRAPFWKKEVTAGGGRWVDARECDVVAAQRWEVSPE